MAIIRWKQVAVVLCDNATILRALCQSIEADSSNKNAILFLIDKNFYIQHMQQLMCLDHRIKCVVF